MTAQSELGAIQTIVQSVYGGRMDYSGLVTDITSGSSAIPPNLQDPTTHLPVTPWSNGSIYLGTCDTTTHCNQTGHPDDGSVLYYIQYNNVPGAQCVPLLSQSIGGLVNVGVAERGGVGWQYVQVTNGLISVSQLASQCAAKEAQSADGTVSVQWTLGK